MALHSHFWVSFIKDTSEKFSPVMHRYCPLHFLLKDILYVQAQKGQADHSDLLQRSTSLQKFGTVPSRDRSTTIEIPPTLKTFITFPPLW